MSELKIFLPRIIIDTHIHGRGLKQGYKTTPYQTLKEAKKGNISVSVFMPNTDPPITTMEMLWKYISLLEGVRKDVGLRHEQYLYFGATDGNLEQCEKALRIPAVVGLKIYPKKLDGGIVTVGSAGIGVALDETILKMMELTAKSGKVLAVHCDDPEIIGRDGHTIEAEVSYVKKIVFFASKVPEVKVVICHVSCRESANIILEAQRGGMRIAIELTPHHLWFSENGKGMRFSRQLDSVFYHCLNKLRSEEDRKHLVDLLALPSPLIFIGSDSACHTREEKLEKGLAGIPSNQEMVAVIITLAVKMGLSEERIAQLVSYNASKFLGIPVHEGFRGYLVEEGIVDNLQYNNGKVTNPWMGQNLCFVMPV